MKKYLLIIITIFSLTKGISQRFDNGSIDGPKTTAQITAITSPSLGQTIYNSDTNTDWQWNGTVWQETAAGDQTVTTFLLDRDTLNLQITNDVLRKVDLKPLLPTEKNQTKFVCTVDNLVSVADSVSVVNVENYATININSSIATFDGNDIIITSNPKDIEITAIIHTKGDFSINRDFYFRDINDPINVEFGNGSIDNGISSYGTYGLNSGNLPARAIIKSGTTVTLNLINQSSAGNQRIKTGSFIDIKEIN